MVDPDKSIGTFYVNLQKPFISTTRLDSNNQCRMDKYVKMDGDNILIKERNKELYNGPKNEIPHKLITRLNSTIYPFLKENYRTKGRSCLEVRADILFSLKYFIF